MVLDTIPIKIGITRTDRVGQAEGFSIRFGCAKSLELTEVATQSNWG